MQTVHTLFLYIYQGGEVAPAGRSGLSQLLSSNGRIRNVTDSFTGNTIEVLDVGADGYSGLPQGMDYRRFLRQAVVRVG